MIGPGALIKKKKQKRRQHRKIRRQTRLCPVRCGRYPCITAGPTFEEQGRKKGRHSSNSKAKKKKLAKRSCEKSSCKGEKQRRYHKKDSKTSCCGWLRQNQKKSAAQDQKVGYTVSSGTVTKWRWGKKRGN